MWNGSGEKGETERKKARNCEITARLNGKKEKKSRWKGIGSKRGEKKRKKNREVIWKQRKIKYDIKRKKVDEAEAAKERKERKKRRVKRENQQRPCRTRRERK